MGTVIGLADASGESAGTFIYDAFGEVLNGSLFNWGCQIGRKNSC